MQIPDIVYAPDSTLYPEYRNILVNDIQKALWQLNHQIAAVVNALGTQGLASARPAAGTQGRVYLATDERSVSYDNGLAWSTVYLPLAGLATDRPSAGCFARIYYATDTNALYFDTSATWLTIATS